MITAKEFRNKYIGKAIDVDGVYGAQCVDLFKQVCYLAGMKPFALGGTGYAEEIAKRFKPLGLDKYFDLVSLANIKYGDWVVWQKGSKDCPVSHVAMFVGKDGNNRIIVLGQNQGKPQANEISLSTHGIIGVLRLKAWENSASKPSISKKTIEQIAQEVMAGKWGSGETRKQKLKAAGYDYNAVQAKVNELCGVKSKPTATKPKPVTPKKQTVTLPASADTWRVYRTNVAPVVGNECGMLAPKRYGGLTYEILARPQKDVVTIQTQIFGKVNIYVGSGTGAIIK